MELMAMTTLYGEDHKQTEVKELNPSANMGHQIWQSIPDFLATKKRVIIS